MYGFIYVWYDKGEKRYYVGSHAGKENDGYVSSSPWMKKNKARRPSDFRRRIVQRFHGTREELFDLEERWLGLISDEELGKRYYNVRKDVPKTRSGMKSKKHTAETIEKMRKGHVSAWETRRKEGRATLSPDTKKKIGESHRNRVFSEEHRRKLSLSMKGRVGGPMSGRKHSEETRARMSSAQKGRLKKPLPEKQKVSISLAMSSLRWFNDGSKSIRRANHPGDGWKEGRVKK